MQEQDVPSPSCDNDEHSAHGPQWSEFFHRNAVQRIISAAILAPAVTVFLWLSPAFATTTVCSFMISTCSYEYACLANRIRLRILTQVAAMEGRQGDESCERRFGNSTSLNDTRSNHSSDSMASGNAGSRHEEPRSSLERSSSSAARTRNSMLLLPDARARSARTVRSRSWTMNCGTRKRGYIAALSVDWRLAILTGTCGGQRRLYRFRYVS